MKIGSTSLTSIKIGSTDITKVIKGGVTYWTNPVYQNINPLNVAILSADGKELVDSIGNENLLIMQSPCLYGSNELTFPQIINLDQDFKFEFWAKRANDTNDLHINKKGTYGITVAFNFAGHVYFKITGSTKSETVTQLATDLSNSAFTRVKIERVSSNILIYYDSVLINTIDLTPYGSIEDGTSYLKLKATFLSIADFNFTNNGIHLIHCPFSENCCDTLHPPLNTRGDSPIPTIKSYTWNIYQDVYHYNYENGCSLYVNKSFVDTRHVYFPYINGVPQDHYTDLDPTGFQLHYHIGDYPAYSNLFLTQFYKFKANPFELTNNEYFDAGGTPINFTAKTAVHNYGKIFMGWQDQFAARIKTYLTDQTGNASVIKTSVGITEPVEFWILAGQSNATTMGSHLNVADEYKKALPKNRIWVTDDFQIPWPSIYTKSSIGYSIAMGLMCLNTAPTFFVNVSQGNTSVAQSAGNDWNVASVGELYDTLNVEITAALAWFASNNISYVIKGLIWFQGEADSAGQAYIDNTKALFAGVRANMGFQVPIYVAEICPFNAQYVTKRANQITICNETVKSVLITTEDITWNVDNVHLEDIGRVEFAQKVLNNLIE